MVRWISLHFWGLYELGQGLPCLVSLHVVALNETCTFFFYFLYNFCQTSFKVQNIWLAEAKEKSSPYVDTATFTSASVNHSFKHRGLAVLALSVVPQCVMVNFISHFARAQKHKGWQWIFFARGKHAVSSWVSSLKYLLSEGWFEHWSQQVFKIFAFSSCGGSSASVRVNSGTFIHWFA